MSFSVNTFSLSALSPVKLKYSFNSTEPLRTQLLADSSNMRFRTHELLNNNKDIAISKHTMLALTDIKSMNSVFAEEPTTIGVGKIAGSFYLILQNSSFSEESERIVKFLGNTFFMGGRGELAIFHLNLLASGKYEIKFNNKYIQVSENYPYTMICSEEPLVDSNSYRQQFDVHYVNQLLVIQGQTKEGSRFLSSGADRILRFIGTELNETRVNDYHMIPVFVSSSQLHYGVDATTTEVRYYNDISETNNQKNLNIKKQIATNTNLLVSCPSVDLAEKPEVGINISLVKTNFSTTGVYNTVL
jgi:hypothetical protein